MRTFAGALAASIAFATIAGCEAPAQSMEGAPRSQIESPADWTSATGAFSLSFKRIGWNLFSEVRPQSPPNDQFTLQIIASDNTPLFCNVTEAQVPLADQKVVSARTYSLLAKYPVGAVVDDQLGGSRVDVSKMQMAGDVAVFRVALQTLDVRRPILRRERIQFAVSRRTSSVVGQIECFVGFGSPEQRWGELEQIFEGVRIDGNRLVDP